MLTTCCSGPCSVLGTSVASLLCSLNLPEHIDSVHLHRAALTIQRLHQGEYTVFRELLQNADDANATSIEVHYETDSGAASVNDWATRPIAKIAVKNDGHVFRDEDWRRLR